MMLWPILVGILYGTALAVTSFLAAGFGHGCYVPIGLFAAPLSLLGPAALFFLPVLWPVVAALAWLSADVLPRRLVLALMCVHYVSAVAAVTIGPFDDWDHLYRTAVPSCLGLGIYAIGQLCLWATILTRRQAPILGATANL
jgi:hypothetical protein